MDIKILILLLIIILIIIYKIHLTKKENFQVKYIRDLNNKLDKIIDKKKPKKFVKVKDSEYSDPSKKFLYNNKIVITGATSNVGYEVAKMLNKYKPFLVICGRKKEKVEKIVTDLKKYNENVYGVWVDLSEKDGGKKMYNAIKKHINTVDILINNAIISKGSKFLLNKKNTDWENEIAVNVNGNIVLTQKVANDMKTRKVKGRIINISSNAVKSASTSDNSGSEILTKNMIEKYSNLLADELYSYKIAVTTIRLDDSFNIKKATVFGSDNSSIYKKYFGNIFDINLDKFTPLFMYAVKAPYHEISGKILSSDSFKQNIELSKIIPAHQMKLNNTYKDFKFNTFTKDKNKTYLVKQNPYPMSSKVTKLLNKKTLNTINNESKYEPILDSIIAKKLKLKKYNIVFFKTEYDCVKKLIDIFVPKYQNIIVVNPLWNILKLVALENKINIDYSTLKKYDKSLTPDFNRILKLINTKTKMIYLSSPNIITGQNIDKDDFSKFLKEVPENIIVLLDQRYYDFVDTKTKNSLKGEKYLKYPNVIVLRSFNNFYSIENLELCYIITNKTLSKFIKESILINQIDHFNESLALEIYTDDYYDKVRSKITKARTKMFKHFEENKIEFFPSDTNFFLIKLKKDKEHVETELEKRNIILYKSNDNYNDFWTLPLSTETINETIVDVLIYSTI
jgi:histidinol-phosphate aminotransferase